MGFVANFTRFPTVHNFENQLTFDKVTESSKVGTFLRHSVVINKFCGTISHYARKYPVQVIFVITVTSATHYIPIKYRTFTKIL